jgi:hypothetical protein
MDRCTALAVLANDHLKASADSGICRRRSRALNALLVLLWIPVASEVGVSIASLAVMAEANGSKRSVDAGMASGAMRAPRLLCRAADIFTQAGALDPPRKEAEE